MIYIWVCAISPEQIRVRFQRAEYVQQMSHVNGATPHLGFVVVEIVILVGFEGGGSHSVVVVYIGTTIEDSSTRPVDCFVTVKFGCAVDIHDCGIVDGSTIVGEVASETRIFLEPDIIHENEEHVNDTTRENVANKKIKRARFP